jgi:magnesium transporter
MVNTLYLPEIREMLATDNREELREFCTALHPARTAEFMDGLSANEAWQVLLAADLSTRVEIFTYFEEHFQQEILESQDRDQIAELVTELAPDVRVDALADIESSILDEILVKVPAEDRRDILRLSQYPDGTAGANMTTDFAKLSESLTVKEALEEIGRQAEDLEMIYYLYIVDDDDHLRGLVSARQLVTGMRQPDTRLKDLMETDLVTVRALDDQEDVADTVAKLDVIAIPVVDDEHHMLGIITHDDVIDVMQEEAIKDAHQSAAVDPLEDSYLRTHLITLSWKRGIWLSILFFCGILTVLVLQRYQTSLEQWTWLVPFIPLVISSGGNSGNQSATLIITALGQGHISLSDWARVVWRELLMGLVLGSCLAIFGMLVSLWIAPNFNGVWVIPLTLILVVISGTLTGSVLPLVFKRMGLDPAIMSNPFVAGIVDILGICIYMTVALLILEPVAT